jgi:DNA-binding transcriptional LysR family regulator
LVIVVPAHHVWAKRKTIKIEDLAGQPIIMREKGSRTRELVDSAFDKLNFQPVIAMEVGSNEAIKRAVEGTSGSPSFPRLLSTPKLRTACSKL